MKGHDYTGVTRELSFAQRQVLELVDVPSLPIDPNGIRDEAHRMALEVSMIEGASSRIRNALRALQERQQNLRSEMYLEEASPDPEACRITEGITDGKRYSHCATHNRIWGPGTEFPSPPATCKEAAS